MTNYTVNQIVVAYIVCTTDLCAVTHQSYMDHQMTDILCTTHVDTLQGYMKVHYAKTT